MLYHQSFSLKLFLQKLKKNCFFFHLLYIFLLYKFPGNLNIEMCFINAQYLFFAYFYSYISFQSFSTITYYFFFKFYEYYCNKKTQLENWTNKQIYFRFVYNKMTLTEMFVCMYVIIYICIHVCTYEDNLLEILTLTHI